MYATEEIEEYLNLVIVSRFNDLLGETIDSILDIPSKYDELSLNLAKRLHDDFCHFGLSLTHLYMNSITPPPEVQKAIDDRSRLGVFDDMNKLLQMKAAMASIIEEKRQLKKCVLDTGEAYEAYKMFCKKVDTRSLTGRAFGDLLAELDLYCLVRCRIVSRGRYGRTREIILDLPEELTAHIYKAILSDFEIQEPSKCRS